MLDEMLNVSLIEINSNPQFSRVNSKEYVKHVDKLFDDIFKLTIDSVFDKKKEKTDFVLLKKY